MATEFTNEGFNVGYRAGVLSERERIIEIIDDELSCDVWEDSLGYTQHERDCKKCELIAEIKGEK